MISRYLKYAALFLAIVAMGIALLLWCPFSRGYYNSFAVTYDKYDYPFITVELEGRDLPLAVRIGSRFPLSLSKETLDGIDKQAHGTIWQHTLDGHDYEIPSFLIPKLKVGDLILENVIANQTSEEDPGILGKFLGEEFNLLLDFPHSRIIACDTYSKLVTKKLANNHWVRIPFEMGFGGLIFHVDTDFGTCRLAIHTTSTFSHIRSSLIPSGCSSISSSFSLGGQKFNNVTFQSINLSEKLSEIDGFIGMDFLKNHTIYFDYTHKIAYIEPPERYFERIPVSFGKRNSPTVNVSIEGNVYPLEIDLGSSFPFSLRQEILEDLHKTYYGTAEWSDFKGHRYESRAYTIPEIKIGNLKFVNEIAKQNREDFHINAALDAFHSQPTGAIGLPILKKYNLFLDFSHSAIYASNNHLPLQQAGLLSQNLLAIPFVLHRDGILLSVETDAGTYRLILDTGSTHTGIRMPHPTTTAQFCLMGHDFGQRSIISIDLSSRFDYDGYLGMDFLREYPLFIDYPNKCIFLDLQKDK